MQKREMQWAAKFKTAVDAREDAERMARKNTVDSLKEVFTNSA